MTKDRIQYVEYAFSAPPCSNARWTSGDGDALIVVRLITGGERDEPPIGYAFLPIGHHAESGEVRLPVRINVFDKAADNDGAGPSCDLKTHGAGERPIRVEDDFELAGWSKVSEGVTGLSWRRRFCIWRHKRDVS